MTIMGGDDDDMMKFLKDHPGGAKSIVRFVGRDSPKEFDKLHDHTFIHKHGLDAGSIAFLLRRRSAR